MNIVRDHQIKKRVFVTVGKFGVNIYCFTQMFQAKEKLELIYLVLYTEKRIQFIRDYQGATESER